MQSLTATIKSNQKKVILFLVFILFEANIFLGVLFISFVYSNPMRYSSNIVRRVCLGKVFGRFDSKISLQTEYVSVFRQFSLV